MDAILASLENGVAQMAADTRAKADQFIANLRKTRDRFESTVKKQAEAGETAWDRTRVKLESEWKSFEAEVKKISGNIWKGYRATKNNFPRTVRGTNEGLARSRGQDSWGGSGICRRASERP